MTFPIDGLAGLVVRDQRHIQTETSQLPSIADYLDRDSTRVLAIASGLGLFPPDRSVPGSLFATGSVQGVFDLLAVGRNVRTFKAPWSRALYWHLNRMLAPSGHLVAPVATDQRAVRDGVWSRGDLEDLFGKSGEAVDDSHLALSHNPTMAEPSSLLPWFIKDQAGLVHALLTARYVRASLEVMRLDDGLLEFAYDGAERIVTRPRQRLSEQGFEGGLDWLEKPVDERAQPPIQYGVAHAAALRSVSYLMAGVAHKVALLRHIIATLGPGGPLSYLDMGGAYGFVAGELLLDEELEVIKAITCDFDSAYLMGAGYLYRSFLSQFRRRFLFSLSPAQQFVFAESVSVISFFSSLLYVPVEERGDLLDRCWEHLEPGGLLVIYEVLRSDPPAKDDAIQYTSSDLDEVLSRYGEPVRFSATACRQLTSAEAGEGTVFRVVRKQT